MPSGGRTPAQDEAERARVGVKPSDDATLAHLNKYYKCVKLLHLIGQVVRSFPGMLPRELKLQAARAIVTLPLRTLSDFAATVRTARADLRAAIVDYIATTKRVDNTQAAMEQVDAAIFAMVLSTGHGLMRRATLALGSSHIPPTLEALREENLGIGFDMIELAINLDLTRDRADIKEAIAVMERVSSSSFAAFVLRQLVIDYLMTFRLPTGLRTKFLHAFELNTTQRLLPAHGEMILDPSDQRRGENK